MSDGNKPIQRSPAGWEAYYGNFIVGNGFGKIFYTTECICCNSRKDFKKMCAAPHTLRKWADKHGDHRPEYQILKPRPEEYYPDGDKGRTKHPGYKKYQERMQSLGFYTSVRMLEKNGFRLPDQAQEKWDHIRRSAQQEAELTEARRRGHQGRNLRRHESPADEVMSEDESDAEVSAEEESGAGVSTRTAEVSTGNGAGAKSSSKEDSDVCNSTVYINTSKRQKTEGAPLNGNNSGMQRKAMRARIAARADTEAPTAMYSDAPAGPPHHTEQLMEKIRLIQEMLPEYGMGFLAACLRAGGYVVASVVEQLLDDSWRQVPELRYLDPSEPLHQYSLRRRRTTPADKQCKGSGALLAADCQAAQNAIVPARSAEPPETPDQTKEEILRAVYPEIWAARAAMQPSSAPSAHDQIAERLRLSARGEQASQDRTEESTPGASLLGAAAPSAHGPVAPGDLPRSSARLTRSAPNQDGEGTPQVGQRPDRALCGAGPADRAASNWGVPPLPAAQSTHQRAGSGRAGEVVDMSAPVGTPCAAPSSLGGNEANLGFVDLTPDSPRASCATQLPAALSNLNVIQGGRVEGGPSAVADQAQYMPSTVAVLPPAFAYPMQATPAASRAAACSLDDAIADLSTMKAAWDSGAASAGRRFSFDSILQCLHSARLREGLAKQQEATTTRLRACASAGEQQKQAVINELRGRVEALEDELVAVRERTEKNESMLASKNKEIKALRSQVDVYEAS